MNKDKIKKIQDSYKNKETQILMDLCLEDKELQGMVSILDPTTENGFKEIKDYLIKDCKKTYPQFQKFDFKRVETKILRNYVFEILMEELVELTNSFDGETKENMLLYVKRQQEKHNDKIYSENNINEMGM